MIEVPRAALLADRIARHADFFSFGTNDLTQTALAFSRDDAEGKFLTQYLEDDVLPRNPFETMDDGVRELVEIATAKARSVRPDIKLGICGEHGGDPGLHRLLSPGRPRLRVVLAVPGADRAAGVGPGGARGRRLGGGMKIDVAFTPGEPPAAAVAIVIDVLRATTTIAHALEPGL